MGNHTATRSRGRRSSRPSGAVGGAEQQPQRWQGGGGEPSTTFLDHTPTTSSARPTVYASPTQRAAIHLQALGTVGLHREAASVFDALGRRVYTKEGTRDAVRWTRAEVDAMHGQALLHNHPFGSSFSDDDVLMGARHEITMHVVGAPPLPAGADPTRTPRGPAYLFTMRYAPIPSTITPGTRAHADFLSARVRRIEQTFTRLDRALERQFAQRVRSGVLAPDQASRAYYHQVWNQVAHALPDDLSYTWEMLG